jgi:hypothetical protein
MVSPLLGMKNSMEFWPSLDNFESFLGDEALMDENNSNFFFEE